MENKMEELAKKIGKEKNDAFALADIMTEIKMNICLVKFEIELCKASSNEFGRWDILDIELAHYEIALKYVDEMKACAHAKMYGDD